MRVYTHYAALALPIRRAGFEPVLLLPIELPHGPVTMAKAGKDRVVIAHPRIPPIVVEVKEE